MKNGDLQRISSISLVDRYGKIIDTVQLDDPQNVTLAILVRNNGNDDDLALASTSPLDMMVLASNIIDKACDSSGMAKNTVLDIMRK